MLHLRSSAGGSSAGRGGSATRFADAARRCAERITFGVLFALSAATVRPAELEVTVVDPGGHGVSEAAVTVTPVQSNLSAPAAGTAVMDQRNKAFVPRLLVVPVGTSVDFPNSDTVSHQVYSFSAAKKFQLPLYKGHVHPPVTFEQKGLVVLGCNIHDEMVGYVYVTDAPYYGKTDGGGQLRVSNLAPGDYRLTVWSPFLADPLPSLTRTIHVAGDSPTLDRVQLVRPLRTRPEPRPRPSDWEY